MLALAGDIENRLATTLARIVNLIRAENFIGLFLKLLESTWVKKFVPQLCIFRDKIKNLYLKMPTIKLSIDIYTVAISYCL